MKKDTNKIAEIERAISKKYGKLAIINPKSKWTPEKEKKHIDSAKKFYEKRNKALEAKRQNKDLNAKEFLSSPSCPVCSKFFLISKDEIYVKKFDCCYECYVEFVDGREERWSSGWRPDKERIFKKS